MTGGFTMTPKWLLCRTEVSGNAKLLYGLLASHGDWKGLAPGCTKLAIVKVKMKVLARELLGSDSEASYKTIRRLVKELKGHGLIHAHLNREKSGASDYHLLEHGWMAFFWTSTTAEITDAGRAVLAALTSDAARLAP